MQQIHYPSMLWTFLLPAVAAATDILTGLLQAGVNNSYNSSVMRKGLYRKLGELACVILAYVCSVAISLPVNITAAVSIYIVIMEIISVLENLSAAGVPFPKWVLRKLKKAADKLAEDPEEKIEQTPKSGENEKEDQEEKIEQTQKEEKE